MYKKIILFIILIGILIFIGVYVYNKPPRDIASASEDFIISANDFNKEYAEDETDANAKYLEKVVAVEGVVHEIQLENEDEPTIALTTGRADENILCGFKKELIDEVKGLKPGAKIKVKGKCDGKGMFGIVMTQCSLIK